MDAWTTVHLGPVWQVELYQGLLAESGIDVFLPDASTKVVDPFITGTLPLSAQLQVRAADVEQARRVLAHALAQEEDVDLTALALATAPDPELGVAPEDAAATEAVPSLGPARSRLRCALERLAARTRWSAVAMITFPLAILFGIRYLRVSRRSGLRATHHGLTLAALVLGCVSLLSLVGLWWGVAGGASGFGFGPW